MSSSVMLVSQNDSYEHKLPVPTIVGFFSIDENRQFLPTFEKLRYLRDYEYPVQVEFDLNRGYDSFVAEDRETFKDDVLKWIDHNNYLEKLLKKEVIVSYRGTLVKIMKTPYQESDGWIICAAKVKDMIFLYEFDTEEEKRQTQAQSNRDRLYRYYGFKFEQYLLSDRPGEEPITSTPVNSNEKFKLVYENKLNNHEILFVAEMDGIKSASTVDLKSEIDEHKMRPNQFVELKTMTCFRTERNFKRFTTLKWWTQSHLAGIEKITCGYRNAEGIVFKLQEYQTNSLPHQAEGWWSTRACMRFLDEFLTFVKNTLRFEEDYTQWIFRRSPWEQFVSAERGHKNDGFDILPEWFIQKCQLFVPD